MYKFLILRRWKLNARFNISIRGRSITKFIYLWSIGYNYLFDDLSKKAYPFDYETFKFSEQKFIPVITNCEKGITEKIEKN